MTDLSPDAQDIVNAAVEAGGGYGCATPVLHARLAAALQAAADQVVPEVVNTVGDEHDDARRDQWVRIRCRFLAIAAELEAQSSLL
jgi:hypothetical protein